MAKRGVSLTHYLDERKVFTHKKHNGQKLNDWPSVTFNKIHYDTGYSIMIYKDERPVWIQKKRAVICSKSKVIYIEPAYYTELFETLEEDLQKKVTTKKLKNETDTKNLSSKQSRSRTRLDETLASTITGKGKSNSVLKSRRRI